MKKLALVLLAMSYCYIAHSQEEFIGRNKDQCQLILDTKYTGANYSPIPTPLITDEGESYMWLVSAWDGVLIAKCLFQGGICLKAELTMTKSTAAHKMKEHEEAYGEEAENPSFGRMQYVTDKFLITYFLVADATIDHDSGWRILAELRE